jgi:hypothetical protein
MSLLGWMSQLLPAQDARQLPFRVGRGCGTPFAEKTCCVSDAETRQARIALGAVTLGGDG